MRAMARQVFQVKRKNSTSCNPPEAKLTVAGSVASKFGPREVAKTCGISVGASVGGTSVGIDFGWISVGVAGNGTRDTVTCGPGCRVAPACAGVDNAAGAQA